MKLGVVSYRLPKSNIAESFRTLRTNLQFTANGRKLKTILITSANANEGKSWITSNLAVSFAQSGKKVLLVDADMRKGRQHKIFGVDLNIGLSNYLSGIGMIDLNNLNDDIENEEYLFKLFNKTDVDNLYVMTAGSFPPNPAELLQSNKTKELINKLNDIFDIVIFDGTPIEIVTDSLILSSLVDNVVLVSSYKQTKMENLISTKKAIESVGRKN